jgi:dihydroorotase
LYFSEADYEKLGMRIKWNPAIKTKRDQEGLLRALIDDHIDLITTDHAPHTLEEKERPYFESMSGAPMVQHSLNCMLDFFQKGKISLEKIVEKMCHNPAILYGIEQRGFVKVGYYADLVLVDLDAPWVVHKDNILYKCGWSPLEGKAFNNKVLNTFVNGHLVYDNGQFNESDMGMPLKTSQQKHFHKN